MSTNRSQLLNKIWNEQHVNTIDMKEVKMI